MTNYPYLWIKNISRLLEKREYSIYTVLCFCLFVGSMRRFLEWSLGGVLEPFPLNFVVTLTGFYWFTFFVFTLILRLLVDQPWRVSINVILVGVFLGIFPPLLDTLLTGTGFKYAYVWGVPRQFNWYLYNPQLNIPIGEAIVLWAVIFFTTVYVGHKTHRWSKVLAAFVLSYAGVIVIGGLASGLSLLLGLVFGWQPTHFVALVNLLQIMGAFGLYLVLQPGVRRALVRRVPRGLFYAALSLLGAVAAGKPSVTALVYAGLLLVAWLIVAGRREYRSAADETGLDVQDVRFLSITGGLLLAALAAANSLALLPLAAFGLVDFLPSSVKRWLRSDTGGRADTVLLAVLAYLVGVAAAAEYVAYEAPRWWISFLPDPAGGVVSGFFGVDVLVGLAIAVAAGVLTARRKAGDSIRGEAPQLASYSVYGVLAASVFVGVLLLFGGWVAAIEYPTRMMAGVLQSAGTFWLGLFVYALLYRAWSRQPWRSVTPALVWGMLLALAVPIVDLLAGDAVGPVSRLAVWGLTVGQAAFWSTSIVLFAVLVGVRARSVWRALGALVSALPGLAAILVLPATLGAWVVERLAWPEEHTVTIVNLARVIAAMFVYFALEPRVFRGLTARIPHALPFMLFCFLGSAFAGQISVTTAIYAGIMFLAGWVALGQNDFFDAEEDGLQGRAPYLDLEDVRFLTITAALGIASLAAAHSTVTFLALAAFASFMLYNFPFYRAKKYFPSNLKIEGVWGFCAFTFGVLAAWEHAAYGAPRWWISHSPLPDEQLLGPFDGLTLVAMLLAFGGFSLVAVLKDYKDWEADRSAGVQTLYTLAVKRGWRFQRLHFILLGVTCVAIASAPLLMALVGRLPWVYSVGGLLAGVLTWSLMSGPPSSSRFRSTLVTLAVYFLFLVLALHFSPAPMGEATVASF